MSIFDKEKGNYIPDALEHIAQPESFENVSHLITRNPIEIDLDQVDRAAPFEMKAITGFSESKLVGQIITPTGRIDIVNTKLGSLDPVIMLVNETREGRLVVDPSDEIDVSSIQPAGKCIVTLDESGNHLYVYAQNPDGDYQIFTRELEQYSVAPLDYASDDPEYL